MGMVHADMSMSLDGFVAGANAGPHNALGDGGDQIQQWMYDVESWRERQSLEGAVRPIETTRYPRRGSLGLEPT